MEPFTITQVIVLSIIVAVAAPIGWVVYRRFRRLKGEVTRARQDAAGQFSGTAGPTPPEGPQQLGEVPEVDPDLAMACASGKCVLFAGTGLGVPAGFPSWRQLLSRIVDQLAETNPESEWDQLRVMLSEGRSAEVADILMSRMSRDPLVDLAMLAARGPSESEIPPTIAALAEIKFRGVVSSSWDDLVQRAFRMDSDAIMTSRSSIDFSQKLRDKSRFLLKPYGTVDDVRGIIFTNREYEDAVRENDAYVKFVGTLCTTSSMLFMGASLATIEDFFESSHVHFSPNRYHYALVPRGESSGMKEERLLAKYNLKVSTFHPSADWEEVTVFARNLRDAVRQASTDADRPPLAPQILKKVTLDNIGPFESFELEFTPEWTILLGDNGCGKSTILRAIALALAGDDERARKAARSLLRSGATSGSIEMVIGESVYRTELIREGNQVKVKSGSFTPVQGGTWLVLGFPALRGNASRNLDGAGAVAPTPAPAVDDLLPLLNNEVDGRFDDLRQWLLNTTISAERKGKGNKYARGLRDAFLETMRVLTPGATLRKLTYTEDPWEVVVETDDGSIPLGMISQGMSSVFAWVGTLSRRLREVYPEIKNPNWKQCLVLNDEIGAHLHPEWQSEIMSLVRGEHDPTGAEGLAEPSGEAREAIFPNVQVIATTHSPLIVANAKAGEVYYLRRPDPDTSGKRPAGQPQLTRIEHSFEGWRADQILTAPAFGMDYARDRKTRLRLQRYEELFAKADRSKDEQVEMEALAKQLDQTVLPRQESAEQRQATKLMTEWMQSRLTELPDEKKAKVLSEAEKYLAELEGAGE